MRKKIVLPILFLLLFSTNAFCSTEEEMGQAAEKAGRLREALTHYAMAFSSAPEGSADDQRLREKIIAFVQKLDPPPAVPEEAERFLIRGEAAVELAKDAQGFEKAAGEFRQALRLAPWLAKGYFNLGLVLEKAERYEEAISNFKLYLLASPNAQDAKEVRTQMIRLEYKLEESQIAADQEKEKSAQEEAKSALLNSLGGRWKAYCSRIPADWGPEIWEVRVNGDQLHLQRWNQLLQIWDAQSDVTFNSETRTFPFLDYEMQAVSSEYMVVEFPGGDKCEWRR